MPTFLTKTGSFLWSRKYIVIGLIAVLIVGGSIWRLTSSEETPQAADQHRQVTVRSVTELGNGTSNLAVIGTVESKSEAEIRTEAGGSITRVNVSLGSGVGAGQILAEIENSSQRAALLQAEGALDAAKASVPNTQTSLASAKGGAVTTLLTAYANVEDTIRDAVDPLLQLPNSSTPSFNVVLTTNSQAKLSLENKRPQFNAVLARHNAQATSLSTESDLSAELSATEAEVRTTRIYIDTLIEALNNAIPSDSASESAIAAYKAEASSARTSLTASLSAITSARSALDVAENNTSGNGAPSSSSASLKQAEGAYNAALANLEKTRIRAPISGTVTNFSIKLGDYVSPSQQVAVVSNTGALEIVTDVTAEDRTRIAVGGTALIEGGFEGTITKIAPAIDPITRKIEVRVGLPQEALRALVSGQSVRVEIARTNAAANGSETLRIPLAALKLAADQALVFTVNEESKLVAHEVTIGALAGEYVEIREGVTPDMEIVTDARGLKAGDTVSVNQ